MSTPTVASFLFDDENVEKIAAHEGLTAARVDQVLDSRYAVTRNRKGRRGLYLLVGRDNGGALISVPIEATHDPYMWRPITAWLSKDSERAMLQ